MSTTVEIPKSGLATDTLLFSNPLFEKKNNKIIKMINNSKNLIIIFSLLSLFTIFLSNSYLFVVFANICFSFFGYYSLKKYKKFDFNLYFIFTGISNFISYVSQIIMLSNYPYDLITVFVIIIFMIIQLWILFYFYFLFLEFKKYNDYELILLKN